MPKSKQSSNIDITSVSEVHRKRKFLEDAAAVSDLPLKRRLHEIEDTDEVSNNARYSEIDGLIDPNQLTEQSSVSTSLTSTSGELGSLVEPTSTEKLHPLVPTMGNSNYDPEDDSEDDSDDESDDSTESIKLFGPITPQKLTATRGYSYASFFAEGGTPPSARAHKATSAALDWEDEATEIDDKSTKPDAEIQSLVADSFFIINDLKDTLENAQNRLRQQLADPSNTKANQLAIAEKWAEEYTQDLSQKLGLFSRFITEHIEPELKREEGSQNNLTACKTVHDCCINTLTQQTEALETYISILKELQTSHTWDALNKLREHLKISLPETKEEAPSFSR